MSKLKLAILPQSKRPLFGGIIAILLAAVSLGAFFFKQGINTDDRMLMIFSAIAGICALLACLITVLVNVFGKDVEQPKPIVSVIILTGVSGISLIASLVVVFLF